MTSAWQRHVIVGERRYAVVNNDECAETLAGAVSTCCEARIEVHDDPRERRVNASASLVCEACRDEVVASEVTTKEDE